jgi:sugar lactone lactonase YvrE
VDIVGLTCVPRVSGIAFDPSGNLWVASACSNTVYKLTTQDLRGGSVTPSFTLSINAPQGLAFDSAGNLWVAESSTPAVRRFNKAMLGGAASPPPDFVMSVTAVDTPSPTLLTPGWLAFDSGGALWGVDGSANVFFRVDPTALSGAGGTVNPTVRVTIPVTALPEGFAFDEQGGLWTAYGAGSIARLSPSQLTVSSTAGSPTTPDLILSSGDIGSASNIALYPAPASSPLYSRLP